MDKSTGFKPISRYMDRPIGFKPIDRKTISSMDWDKGMLPVEVKFIEKKGITDIVNAKYLARELHRNLYHLMKAISVSLCTEFKAHVEGKLPEGGYYSLIGNFTQARVQEAIYEFIEKFVICPECRYVETILTLKKDGTGMIYCHNCKSDSTLDDITPLPATGKTSEPCLGCEVCKPWDYEHFNE